MCTQICPCKAPSENWKENLEKIVFSHLETACQDRLNRIVQEQIILLSDMAVSQRERLVEDYAEHICQAAKLNLICEEVLARAVVFLLVYGIKTIPVSCIEDLIALLSHKNNESLRRELKMRIGH